MPFCLNPECPHRKKIGRPAELVLVLEDRVIDAKEVIENHLDSNIICKKIIEHFDWMHLIRYKNGNVLIGARFS